jgi:hypothetical protein
MITPLQPREFFRGGWRGEGEMVPHPLLRPFVGRERLRLFSEALWLSDTIWVVKDRMEFGSGFVYERKMFAELVAPDRIHDTIRMRYRGIPVATMFIGPIERKDNRQIADSQVASTP